MNKSAITHRLFIDSVLLAALFCAGVLIVDGLLPGVLAGIAPLALFFLGLILLLFITLLRTRTTTWQRSSHQKIIGGFFLCALVLIANALSGLPLILIVIFSLLSATILLLLWHDTVYGENDASTTHKK